VATLYHYVFGWQAPYALSSLPVLLGTAGGIGLLIGPAGLLWLNLRRHPLHGDPAQKPMDRGFIALLFATSLTGLALMIWRDTGAMALLLAVHLGVVMALRYPALASRARRVPLRGAAQVGRREAAAGPAATRVGLTRDNLLAPSARYNPGRRGRGRG
jgi:hypothetical protein